MRILIVNKFLYPNGGSETYIFSLGKQLERMGHEVQYFGMEHEGRIVGNRAGSYTEDMNFHGSGIRKLLYPFQILYSRDARRKIRVVLEDFYPDVVHLNNINFQITPSVIDEIRDFDPKIRIVYTAHDYQWVCPNHTLRIPETGELCQKCIDGAYQNCRQNRCIHNSRLRSTLGTMEAQLYRRRHTYRWVDTIICPSNFMKGMLEHHPDLAGRCIVMHNFLEIPSEPKISSISDRIRTKLPERYVLYFGRFDEEKGMKTLLACADKLSGIPFVFAGKGQEEAAVNTLPNGINLGFLQGDELTYVISHAEVSVYPSEWYENCPFSVMESQMYGTPVIASDIGGIPELIEDGRTGFLFKAGDAEELAQTIDKVFHDEAMCRRMSGECLQQAGRFLSLEDYTARLMRIYQGVDEKHA